MRNAINHTVTLLTICSCVLGIHGARHVLQPFDVAIARRLIGQLFAIAHVRGADQALQRAAFDGEPAGQGGRKPALRRPPIRRRRFGVVIAALAALSGCQSTQGPLAQWRMFLDVASISRLAIGAQGPSLRSYNETHHLSSL